MLLTQSYPTPCNPMNSSPRLLCPWTSPGKNTGVGCCFLLQRVFLIQGSNLQLLHWQVDSLPLSRLGSPLLSFRCCDKRVPSSLPHFFPSFFLLVLLPPFCSPFLSFSLHFSFWPFCQPAWRFEDEDFYSKLLFRKLSLLNIGSLKRWAWISSKVTVNSLSHIILKWSLFC